VSGRAGTTVRVLSLPHVLIVDTDDALAARLPRLGGAFVVGLDLRSARVHWAGVDVAGATFAGCRLSMTDETTIRSRGAVVLPPLDGVGFDPYRSRLYTFGDLMAGYVPGAPRSTLDARIGAIARLQPTPLLSIARGLHDACIDAALVRFLHAAPGPVVGVMGSHACPRGDPLYRRIAELGRRLTMDGFVVATGGGPGLMEAANLGAWLAPEPLGALDAAIDRLAEAPDYRGAPEDYFDAAQAVRERWAGGGVSLGVPTWIYVDEPVNQFITSIAKYFENSIRENGLLAIALGGVVFTPGGSGTAQEIFTDGAQNDYTLYQVRSPMLFLEPDADTRQLIEGLEAIARRGGWDHLIRVVDDVEGTVSALRQLVPDGAVPRGWPLRRRHR
jgi:predicted Rossmann-fold nucleotide-binding protein